MINMLSGLRVGRARNTASWEQVLEIFQPRKWTTVPTAHGRMVYTVVDGNLLTGRMLALVMLEDCQAPDVGYPVGTSLLGLRGQLHTLNNQGELVVMEPWDLLSLDGGFQQPSAHGLYLGLWHFPRENTLLRMVEVGMGH